MDWRVELFHSNGVYTLSYGNASIGLGFEVAIEELPSGYVWSRNAFGQIGARLVLEGNDSNGYVHEATLNLFINHEPTNLEVELTNIGSTSSCSSVTLAFSAVGATDYNVYYQRENQSFWYFSEVPQGLLTHTISGLNERYDYTFRVEAVNEFGMISGPDLERQACDLTIIVYPNPTVLAIRVIVSEGEIIDRVDVEKINQPTVQETKYGDGHANELDIDLSNLPPGLYSVRVLDVEGKIGTQTIVVF